MNRRNFSFLNNITDEDRTLLSRVLDWAETAEEKYVTRCSFFMDERQCGQCEQVLRSVKYENYMLWGGYENAEREMLCVYPPYSEDIKENFPIVPVTFVYRKEDRLSHRDFLGSLMALQIKRECVGDILVGEGSTAVFLKDTVAQDVLSSLHKIGRVGVKTETGFDINSAPKTEFREISGTVASLRADSVISLALRISREKASTLIIGGSAEINHLKTESPKKIMETGDKFSVRGYGKFLLRSIDGTSKKDRLHITVCKYI